MRTREPTPEGSPYVDAEPHPSLRDLAAFIRDAVRQEHPEGPPSARDDLSGERGGYNFGIDHSTGHADYRVSSPEGIHYVVRHVNGFPTLFIDEARVPEGKTDDAAGRLLRGLETLPEA